MLASLSTFAEWEKNHGPIADIHWNALKCYVHRDYTPLSMHGTGPLYVEYEVTAEPVERTVDVGFRRTEIRSAATYGSNTLHVDHPDPAVDQDLFAAIVSYYDWECFPEVDGPDDRFEDGSTYGISVRLEHDPARALWRTDKSLAELERTRSDQPDAAAVERVFEDPALSVATWDATLSAVSDDGLGTFESAAVDYRVVLPHDALPQEIPFVGTKYQMRTGIAASDRSFVESATASLSEWRGTVERVDDETATVSLDTPTGGADGETTLTLPVDRLPDASATPTETVTVVVHWTYDGTRTDERSVAPTVRRLPDTSLEFAYDGRVAHDSGREIAFSNAIRYGYGHDSGAILVFDPSEAGVDDPDVVVPDARPVARIDEHGDLDWIVDAEGDDSTVSIRDAFICDDDLYTLKWSSPNARFDATTGHLVRRFD